MPGLSKLVMRTSVAAAAAIAAGCGGAGNSGASAVLSGLPSNGEAVAPKTSTIPFWQSSFSYGGKTYAFRMVGTDPITSGGATTIGSEIVPVRLVFSDGTTLDGGSVAGGIASSPLYANGSYAAGYTQYGDAVMRSEFWKYAARENYHVLLAAPVAEPAVTVNVPAADGYVKRKQNGTKIGYVTFEWFIKTVEPQIIAQLNIKPTSVAIFATNDVSVLQPGNYCCYAGYHEAFPMSTPSGPAIFTTVWASVTTHGVETLSHEFAEWLNDPFYTNDVPKWVQPNTNNACGGSQLEVGDPVTTQAFTVGGYVMQDEAFYSWFTRDMPSLGIDGRYDLLGKLTKPAVSCT
jgi:hypothetical protein